ncbi:MAG: acyl carrier protein [Clostridia bacterium]|nr:acyl carrier protein [Clostridia bacterium]MBQ1374837.1 acyl carrier protein [Clostridia bacterium]MBQ1435994.1 acyl carrier protein [Clostridia bacterium]MBQ4249510.1 acyl carrier protein [Clostridia bacterium]
MDDTYDRLLPLISIATGMESDEITPASSFKKDLLLDSLDAVEFAMELEFELGVKIEREDMGSIATVGDLITYIDSKR